MLCEKCRFIEKRHEPDEYGNIHIYWKCGKRFWNLYHQVNYSDIFLSDLRSGKHVWYREALKEILPKGKSYRDLQTVEVFFTREVKDCRDYREYQVDLTRFLDKSTKNVTR